MRDGSGAGAGVTGAGVLAPLRALGLRSGRLWTTRHPPGRGSGAAGGGPSITGCSGGGSYVGRWGRSNFWNQKKRRTQLERANWVHILLRDCA